MCRYVRLMKKLAIGILAAVAVGCGGSNGGGVSTFQGHFAGEWIQLSELSGQALNEGTFDIVVDRSGDVTGTFSETHPVRSGAVTGKIRNNGVWSFNVVFPSGMVRYNADAELEQGVMKGTFLEVDTGIAGFYPYFELSAQP